MKLTMTIVLLYAAAMSAAAQPYSQPVRDVDDFQARNAVEATCVLHWSDAGNKGVASCNAYTVPAGKRLAMREVTVSCAYSNTVNSIPWLVINAANGPTNAFRYVRLSTATTSTGGRIVIGTERVFAHYDAGSILRFTGQLEGPDPMGATCFPIISGFLISMN